MNPTVILSTVLTLALVAMFKFGLYSLKAKYGTHPVPPSPAPSAGTTASSFAANRTHAASSASVASNPDEWEANAHWIDHNIPTGTSGRYKFGQSPEPLGERASPGIDDPRHEVHEALTGETDDTSASFAFAQRAEATTSSSPSSGSIPRCPQIGSSQINTLNRARKAGSTLGSVARATGGMAMALSGAEAGAVVGPFLLARSAPYSVAWQAPSSPDWLAAPPDAQLARWWVQRLTRTYSTTTSACRAGKPSARRTDTPAFAHRIIPFTVNLLQGGFHVTDLAS